MTSWRELCRWRGWYHTNKSDVEQSTTVLQWNFKYLMLFYYLTEDLLTFSWVISAPQLRCSSDSNSIIGQACRGDCHGPCHFSFILFVFSRFLWCNSPFLSFCLVNLSQFSLPSHLDKHCSQFSPAYQLRSPVFLRLTPPAPRPLITSVCIEVQSLA